MLGKKSKANEWHRKNLLCTSKTLITNLSGSENEKMWKLWKVHAEKQRTKSLYRVWVVIALLNVCCNYRENQDEIVNGNSSFEISSFFTSTFVPRNFLMVFYVLYFSLLRFDASSPVSFSRHTICLSDVKSWDDGRIMAHALDVFSGVWIPKSLSVVASHQYDTFKVSIKMIQSF